MEIFPDVILFLGAKWYSSIQRRGGEMEGGEGVVLALQNEFTEIFYIIFCRFLLRGNEFYPNIPSNVELCQIQGLIGLKETTKQNTN